jgi:Ca-activated chloride channel family protein
MRQPASAELSGDSRRGVGFGGPAIDDEAGDAAHLLEVADVSRATTVRLPGRWRGCGCLWKTGTSPLQNCDMPRLVVALAAIATAAWAQQAPRFGASTDLVSVYATVQDRDTRLVSDLTQDDFVVTDNGREQKITFFSNEVLPISVVIMLDRSQSMFPHQFVLRDGVIEFIKRMLPDDKARIGSFGDYTANRVVMKPDVFTSSKEELFEVLKGPIRVGQISPVWIAIDHAVASLSSLDGRRVVLVFTDGFDEPAPTLYPVTYRQLIARVRQENVMVYALGFAEVEVSADGKRRIHRPHKDLRDLADDSGGGYFEVLDTNDLPALFTRVSEELHRQYWIGFPPPMLDGRVHEITVKVKKPGLTVRARQTYLAKSK